ncbi:fibrobacter succinogenes major paralogous domain-containing protein [Flavobacteriales bacterium]|nr:fibrobacter succinogenes major paralogous domain-containing protein [Flavobacteriales bacterium]
MNYHGYDYATVQIGEQCWFAENLRTTVYANGDTIPAGLTDGEWTSTTAGATAVYGEASGYCENYSPEIDACEDLQSLEEYGRLYNWYAVDDARGLCPSGWHVPTYGEWTNLENYITSQGYAGTEGTALKSIYGWTEDFFGSNGTDDFGFSALPGGSRNAGEGYFYGAGTVGYWWSSSPNGDYANGDYAWILMLQGNFSVMPWFNGFARFGDSVRCLRD